MLKAGGVDDTQHVQFVVCDFDEDDGWTDAVKDCRYVLHVASPFPSTPPKQENDLIVPAREGTLRVLRAARDAGVSRCVMTSSFDAVGSQKIFSDGKVFAEEDWSDTDPKTISAYAKSKTIAERGAWDFIKNEGESLGLSVINPVAIFGPVFAKDYSTSILLIERLMNGSLPGCPQLGFGVIDVRDVADLHLRAMTSPHAKDERFLCVSGDFLSIQEIGRELRDSMGEDAKNVPTRLLPNFLLKFIALWDAEAALIVPELGKTRNASNSKARTILDWDPRSPSEALVSTAESLIKIGVLKKFT